MSTISFFGTLVDTIQLHYQLPPILRAEIIPSPRSNCTAGDAVYRIDTFSQSYVLRPFRTESRSAIDLHNQFLRWSASGNYLCTQKLIETKEGLAWFEFANHMWWLADYIQADDSYQWTEPKWNENICLRSGAALSELHAALHRFELDAPVQVVRAGNSVLVDLENKLADAFGKAHYPDVVVKETTNSVKSAISSIGNIESSHRQLVHGDFHPGNMLCRSGNVVAIIDFEYLHFEDPLYDLAYGTVMFCTRWSDSANDGEVDPELLRAFLSGYCAGSRVDASNLLSYLKVAAAVCLTWLLERDSDRPKALHFINVIRQLNKFSTMTFLQVMGNSQF